MDKKVVGEESSGVKIYSGYFTTHAEFPSISALLLGINGRNLRNGQFRNIRIGVFVLNFPTVICLRESSLVLRLWAD